MTFDAFLHRFATHLADGSALALGIAFLAGILSSSVCPCTLPVGIGMAGIVGASESQSPRKGFSIAISFFTGIVAVLMVLGALAGRFGAVLSDAFGRYWALTMALLSLLAASLAFLGPRLKVQQLTELRRPGIMGAFGYGVVFSLGTSAAPLLLLLTLAAAVGRPETALALAFSFGLGRGLPFLLVGIFAGTVMRLAHLSSWRRVVELTSGSALLFVAVYYARVFIALQ